MILTASVFEDLQNSTEKGLKQLAVLIDPDKFNIAEASYFLAQLPESTSHIFIGGSTAEAIQTSLTVKAIKAETTLPVVLFPGDHTQITDQADALLFLSLISGRNPEYLIEQQVRSVEKLIKMDLEIIPTGYILIDGGKECAVHKKSNTIPIPQQEVKKIVYTALAGQYSGKKLIYLEAGSGAEFSVLPEVIRAVKEAIGIPLIVGGGIRSMEKLQEAYNAGADMAVVGTAFESGNFFTS